MVHNTCCSLCCKLMQIDIYQVLLSIILMMKPAHSPKDKNKQTSVLENLFIFVKVFICQSYDPICICIRFSIRLFNFLENILHDSNLNLAIFIAQKCSENMSCAPIEYLTFWWLVKVLLDRGHGLFQCSCTGLFRIQTTSSFPQPSLLPAISSGIAQ